MQNYEKLTFVIMRIAGCGLIFAILLTVADVLLGNMFRRPIVGAYEIIELCLAFMGILSLGSAIRSERLIVIDAFDRYYSKPMTRVLIRIARLSVFLALAFLVFAVSRYFFSLFGSNERTQLLKLPLYIKEFVIVLGLSIATIEAALLVLKRN